MITVTIWHNMVTDAGRHTGMLDGYQPGHPMVRVFAYQADPAGRSPEAIAEEAFAICNGHPRDAGGGRGPGPPLQQGGPSTGKPGGPIPVATNLSRWSHAHGRRQSVCGRLELTNSSVVTGPVISRAVRSGSLV